MQEFREKLIALPEGSFYCIYKDSKYVATKSLYSDDKIIKLYAKELKGNNIVSGNYFLTIKQGLLKPCEMSDEKVISFVKNLELI